MGFHDACIWRQRGRLGNLSEIRDRKHIYHPEIIARAWPQKVYLDAENVSYFIVMFCSVCPMFKVTS